MSKIKDLLSEQQVRRFMRLAEISSMSESEVTEEAEELEEAKVTEEAEELEEAKVTEEAEELEESVEVTEEAEELEEGGLAARRENLPIDGPKGRLQPDRIREEEEVSEGEEVVEEEASATSAIGEAVKQALQKEGVKGLNGSQVQELIRRTEHRLTQEGRKARQLAERERRVRVVEAQMIRQIEAKRTEDSREALIETLVSRVVGRLKNLKDQ